MTDPAGKMTSVQTGNRAEQAAADYLVGQGYTIIELNYRRKYCEIDVVAQRGACIYFVEVKYRATSSFGSGFDYITGQKLQRMRRAAAVWVAEHRWRGEYDLAALEVGGPQFEVLNFVESVF